MNDVKKLTIPGAVLLMLILAPYAIDGWQWIHSVIGAVVLGVAVTAWLARDRFL